MCIRDRQGVVAVLLRVRPVSVGQELVNALHHVHAGQTPLNPLVARQLVQSLAAPRRADTLDVLLTEREIEIARLVARGDDNQGIANALGISCRTVGTHVTNILRKANVANRTQLALLMLRQGLASLHEE